MRAARLGERLLGVIGIVAAMGFAAEVSQCLYLCGVTYRRGDRNDMLVQSLERQCGARAARALPRENFFFPGYGIMQDVTQLVRAVLLNNLPRVLQLVQLGAPLDAIDSNNEFPALHYACTFGHEKVAAALIDGGASVSMLRGSYSPLHLAIDHGHEAVVRLLLARGADLEIRLPPLHWTSALHSAASVGDARILELLCSMPAAAALLASRDSFGRTPLATAVVMQRSACEAVLRARGAPL